MRAPGLSASTPPTHTGALDLLHWNTHQGVVSVCLVTVDPAPARSSRILHAGIPPTPTTTHAPSASSPFPLTPSATLRCAPPGVVSRIEVTDYSHGSTDLLAIQIDAAINGGNSGGPVFNRACQCVGIAFQVGRRRRRSGVGWGGKRLMFVTGQGGSSPPLRHLANTSPAPPSFPLRLLSTFRCTNLCNLPLPLPLLLRRWWAVTWRTWATSSPPPWWPTSWTTTPAQAASADSRSWAYSGSAWRARRCGGRTA